MNKKIFGVFAITLFAVMMMAPMCIATADEDAGQPNKPADCENGYWVKVVDLWESRLVVVNTYIRTENGIRIYVVSKEFVLIEARWHWEFILDDPSNMTPIRYDEESQMSLCLDC